MTPKDKKNVSTLVNSIIEKDLSMIRVKDSALIPYYVKNSKYMVEAEPEDKAEVIFYAHEKPSNKKDFDALKESNLKHAQESSANYIFVSYLYEPNGTLIGITNPFKIISENEIGFLLKNFYKDVPKEVSKAASELGITLFDKYYSSYLKNKLDDVYTSREEFDNYLRFINFVFNLPYEEQNLKINKKILDRGFHNFDTIGILVKEYSQGKYFQEYFDVLYESDKENVVSRITALERNKDHDVFLLKKGFVVGEDSALQLYRQDDPKAFTNYFEKVSHESKKILIEKIYEEPEVNQEVVDWLEKNYMPLLREVGFSGGKQNGSNS